MRILILFVLLLVSYVSSVANVTLSGVSSGGAFAVQFHISWSSMVNGVGVIAGIPYWCAQDNVVIAQANCMKYPDLISVTELIAATTYAYATGTVDSPSILSTSKVYLYSGTLDSVVNPGVVKKLQDYYQNYIPSRNIKTVYNIPSDHAFVTADYGNDCSFLGTPFINNCQYDAAGEILQFLYGNLNAPVTPNPNNIVSLGQASFIPIVSPTMAGMADEAYLYIPSACQKNTGCEVHVALHGCEQTLVDINTTFVTSTGYNGWAEANNIIILYPQAKANALNPNGCWDWWGYTGPAYASKLGVQIAAVKNMIDYVTSKY